MPIRDYRCDKCHTVVEWFDNGYNKTRVEVCPKCGGVKFTKLPAAPNFKVKDGTPIFGGSK